MTGNVSTNGSSPRVLVLGGGGMLGHKVVQALRAANLDTWCTLHGSKSEAPWSRIPLFDDRRVIDRLDVMDQPRLEEILRELVPDVIVNAVGVIKQRPQAHDAVTSIAINSLLPHALAMIAAEWGGRVIHFSTDCVFSGDRGMYREVDLPDARDLYGRSKALGEVGAANALTLRTSIIGRELRHGSSLLEWFLAQEGSRIGGFTRAWWSGVPTNHLAEIVVWLITQRPAVTGVMQLSSGRISKYDLLLRLRSAYDLDVEIDPDDSFFCDRSLDGSRFEAETGYRFPGWDSVIAEMAADPTPYTEWLQATA